MLDLSRTRQFDVVHNNSLHHLPIAMAAAVATPMVTTLHTPPTPWLESAIQAGPCPVTFVAVSEHTARAWRPSASADGHPERHRPRRLARRAREAAPRSGSAAWCRRRAPTSRSGPRERPAWNSTWSDPSRTAGYFDEQHPPAPRTGNPLPRPSRPRRAGGAGGRRDRHPRDSAMGRALRPRRRRVARVRHSGRRVRPRRGGRGARPGVRGAGRCRRRAGPGRGRGACRLRCRARAPAPVPSATAPWTG